MFSTDFIFRQQENLVDNQKCQAGFRPLCNKILLLMYIYFIVICTYIFFSRCQKKLTVGVTDESMLKSKKLNDLIEPVEKRIAVVSQFLKGTLENKFP